MLIDKIICVGKNYLAHAKELGDAIAEKPVIFLKPASVLQQASSWNTLLTLEFPPHDTNVQPECEIAIRIAHDAYQLSQNEAAHAISDLTLGLDMTLRTTQSSLKKQGHPWTIAKVFKDAAVLGPWIPYSQFSNYMDINFEMLADGVVKQQAKGCDMMMTPENLVAYISHYFPLKRGDVIYTGTPAGVFAIEKKTRVTLQWGNYRYDVTWK
jgi:2-keto-4-pentenoate hydratase/2-oxohepta-3-ene-1,7-dioic acid hydratase in catechol pathway